jgi:ankyrin repeat protein
MLGAGQTARHTPDLVGVSASSASGAALSAALTAILLGGAYLAYNYPELMPYTKKSSSKPAPAVQSPQPVAATTHKNTEFDKALLLAAQLDRYKDIEQALLAGANVNAQSPNGLTALMYNVLTAKDARIIKLLIRSGADVNAQDNQGTTALMYAAQRTFPLTTAEPDPLVRTLVDAGADINMTDNEGRTALEYLPEHVTKLFTANRKRFLRQENVKQLMSEGTSQ